MDSATVGTFAAGIVEDLLTDILDDLVLESEHISHHTGVRAGDTGYLTELVLKDMKQNQTQPGFDMKWEKKPVGPNGEEYGGLLTGSKARRSKKGVLYNVVPINPMKEPSGFQRSENEQRTLFSSANMLAEKKGTQAAEAFLKGLGADESMVYQWKTERYQRMRQTDKGSVVFRTVTDQPNQGPAWWYPPKQSEVVSASEIDALLELEKWLGG